jgi:hypothetical protein
VSPAEREARFRADLAELLKRHGAEMTITDDGEPWGLHSPIVMIRMSGETVDLPYMEFEL